MNKGLQKIYSEIPAHYELINHVLTLGLDVVCRKRAAGMAIAGDGERWLDVCCGTGEMAVDLRRFACNGVSLFAADFSPPMIREAVEKRETGSIHFLLSEAGILPFADNSFDLITISFATRNINSTRESLIGCLREFHRVLKPGGRFVNLETSQPKLKLIRGLMHLYVRLTVKQIGSTISGSKASYSYLSSSIPRFYDPEELAHILKEAGFSGVSFKRLFFGVAAVHRGFK